MGFCVVCAHATQVNAVCSGQDGLWSLRSSSPHADIELAFLSPTFLTREVTSVVVRRNKNGIYSAREGLAHF